MALINWVSHHIFVVFLNLLDITRLNKMNPSQMQQSKEKGTDLILSLTNQSSRPGESWCGL